MEPTLSLSFSRPLGNMHFAVATVRGDPVVVFQALTVTDRARDTFGRRSERARLEGNLCAFVQDFAFDSRAQNRVHMNMILRDDPDKRICVWTTPGGDTAHVLMWDECANIDSDEQQRRAVARLCTTALEGDQ